MSKHTPGPWEVRKHKFDGYCVHAPTNEKKTRCDYIVARDVNGDDTPEATYGAPEANARLIAAAPDLLAALQNIRTSHLSGHNESEAWCWVDAAIAKATGDA